MLPPKKFLKITRCNGCFSAFGIIFTQILFKFFDPESVYFAKYDAFCLHIFDYACSWRKGLLLSKRFKFMEKLYASKTFLKMAGGG